MIQFVLPVIIGYGIWKTFEHFQNGGTVNEIFEGHLDSGGLGTGDKSSPNDKSLHGKSLKKSLKAKPKKKVKKDEHKPNSLDGSDGSGDDLGGEQHATKTVRKSGVETPEDSATEE